MLKSCICTLVRFLTKLMWKIAGEKKMGWNKFRDSWNYKGTQFFLPGITEWKLQLHISGPQKTALKDSQQLPLFCREQQGSEFESTAISLTTDPSHGPPHPLPCPQQHGLSAARSVSHLTNSFQPHSPALPPLTDSTKLNCTKHTLENLINIIWKYNWGLAGAGIFHFEAQILPLIYEQDLVLQTTMPAKINVNPSYAFPQNLQSLSSKVLCVTTANITDKASRYSHPLRFPGSPLAAKEIRSIWGSNWRKVWAMCQDRGLLYPWIRFSVTMTSDTSVDSFTMNI